MPQVAEPFDFGSRVRVSFFLGEVLFLYRWYYLGQRLRPCCRCSVSGSDQSRSAFNLLFILNCYRPKCAILVEGISCADVMYLEIMNVIENESSCAG